MTGAPHGAILIIGGSGYFGRLLAADLLRHTDHHVTLAGRRCEALENARAALIEDTGATADRVEVATCNLERRDSLDDLVARCSVAVCAAGPFRSLPLTLLDTCADQSKPYVDLSDDRDYVRRVCARLEECGDDPLLPPICTAWSAVSALSCALARIGTPNWKRLDTMRIFIAPGNRQPRNRGAVASLLASLGKPFQVPFEGRSRRVYGWSRPRKFNFPLPVGRRAGYLIDVPDHDLAARWLGAGTVEFRVGAEISWLNAAASLLAFKRRVHAVPDLSPLAGAFCWVMGFFGSFGTDAGAVGVELEGLDGSGVATCVRVSVVAEHHGPGIAVLPAAIMADRLACGGVDHLNGLVRHDDWITRDELDAACSQRGFRLVVE